MTMSTKSISPPLPLPIGFKLLPSLLPGKQLTPCLYTTINDYPIFLIISPTREPQLSFLSIILALKIYRVASPLSLAIYELPDPDTFSTLNGLAPWSDLWIPLAKARVMVRNLGIDRLFWDIRGRGLLGDVDDAVSWEEDGGWSHNWIPAKSHLPASSHSFDNLLSTKWPSIQVIPDQRCIHTPAGSQRLAQLISEGQFENPSLIRHEFWDTIWHALLTWTKRSYSVYKTRPIRLVSPDNKCTIPGEPISTLMRYIPILFDLQSTPAPPIDSSDINTLFPSQKPSIFELVAELSISIWNISLAAIPITFLSRFTISSERQPELSKLRAKIDLALCAMSWDIVVGIWNLKRDNARMKKALEEGGQTVPDINPSKLPRSNEEQTPTPAPSRGNRKSRSDAITRLERRRGASPPPITQTPESSPSPSDSGESSSSDHKRLKSLSSRTPSRSTRLPHNDNARGTPQAQPGPSLESEPEPESDWFDVSPRKSGEQGEDHEKIQRWYSRSPRRSPESESESSSSTSSGESDHLPTPYSIPLSLPSVPDYELKPRKFPIPLHGDDIYRFSRKSDRWLIDDCNPNHQEEEVTGLMRFPIVVDIVETVTSPVIALGLFVGVLMIYIWSFELDMKSTRTAVVV